MIGYDHIFKNDYDKRVKIGGEYVFCYSKAKLDSLYPEKDYSLIGEVRNTIPKDKPDSKRAQKRAEKKIGNFKAGGKVLDVFPHKMHSGFLYKESGYVCVGDGKFIAVRASRIPFFVALFSMLALLVALVVIIIGLISNEAPPVVIDPDNPLPEIDPDIEPIEQDTSEKVTSEKGGGSVSMVYTKGVTLSLSNDKATIFYQNPNSSNHSVVLELYIVSDETEYFIGRTGLIPAGSAIYEMDTSEKDANIRAGTYTGLYRTSYYNPETGERAVVGSDITNVSVTVTE